MQGVIVFLKVFLQLLLSKFLYFAETIVKACSSFPTTNRIVAVFQKSVLSVAPYKIAISYPYFKTAINLLPGHSLYIPGRRATLPFSSNFSQLWPPRFPKVITFLELLGTPKIESKLRRDGFACYHLPTDSLTSK